ncbi:MULTISPECIES: Fe(2+) transporter permease subunit FeoB [Dickeya]|uniref:Ferrous iron transport protein B n=1 Tax=Dickeya fangzhongdai TaxID=1778540 RepID=A0A2K8QMC4_9GAMM|nr:MULTISPECIES: Fe(2+) transporter permease subunit FeoB [Dickeya]ATZ94653.1 ferrous iron transporter B [Dickeya fangzhongdai]QOH48094.1 Fe(2+) transporter permease subunit FeoB [Dickeya fangzhongdai]QOH52395.1 Fe(2+) transporter permease subunit FeoB [Dickeya fangzhongdai]WES88348.1 Fe(2+) transporter permease subunit FeoB [Dickeya fangzhongdai]WOY00399.1 Fe(2+) transporter permease subunit FeoB [Dickeya fangzhongdai]
MSTQSVICVVGNPNCGKTTLFNVLTGGKQTVGNWPGVTVEKKVGSYRYQQQQVTLVDLPGVYSLNPSSESSEDERVARDYILSGEANLVLNIVDASNLERNLYLTAQLLDMQVPMVVAVNMMDIAIARKLDIDIAGLQQRLGCPVIPITASQKKGIEMLREVCQAALAQPVIPPVSIPYDAPLSQAAQAIAEQLQGQSAIRNPHWLAIQLLEGDVTVRHRVPADALAFADAQVTRLVAEYEDELDIFLADARYQFVGAVAREVITRRGEVSATLTDKIDRIVLHRFFGIPIFLLVMYLMFVFTINVGSAFIDFFDKLFGTLLVEGFGELLLALHTPEWLKTLLADGVGGGIQTVSTFIPVIGCLYLFLSWLEDSGYMARAAFVMDRFMRSIGLPGKAFVPLIVGFGCNVPAVMATRTMERHSDRVVTVMMAPFMSCGARLPVYVLFASALFVEGGQNLVFGLYLVGIAAAIATGFLLKNTALKGDASAFVMEIPPYHLPSLRSVLIRTWERLKGFLLRAGRLIVVVVTVLGFLNSMGTDGSFGNQNTQKSVLSAVGQAIVPVFKPMGIREENWPAAVGVFTGIFAKEAVVGTLDSLYGAMAASQSGGAKEEKTFSLIDGIHGALATIPENLGKLGDALLNPMGINVGDLTDTDTIAKDNKFSVTSLTVISQLFDGRLGAFSYLLMVLLYIPCVAAVSAIWREVGTAWTLFCAGWTIQVGYSTAVVVYQIGRFAQHPLYSSCALVGVAAMLCVTVMMLRRNGLQRQRIAVGEAK